MSESLESTAQIKARLSGVRTAMVTTVDERGTLSSRPVTIQEITDGGDVWFLVDGNASWVGPAEAGPLNVAVVDGDDTWVSFAGRAQLVREQATVDQLSDAFSETFFADGADIIALRAAIDRIEWWTAEGSLTQMIEIAKAKVTGDEPDVGDSGSIEV